MKRVLVSIICAVLFVMSAVPFSHVFTSETESEIRFVLSGTPLCKSNFLCWETVPDTLKYEVVRDEAPVATLSSGVNRYIDYDLNLTDGSTHYYTVKAIDKEEKLLAESLSANLTNVCYDESNCYTHMEFTIDSYMYRVDGVMYGPMETPPQIIEGRTFLVIRFVAEAVSAEVGWVSEQKKVTIITKAGKFIELWVGQSEARIDGKFLPIDPDNPDVVPVIKNGRTLLPLRFVGEQLGASGEEGIIWRAEERMVELNIFDESCVSPYHWRLNVDSIDKIQGSLSCTNDLDVQFFAIADGAIPDEIEEGSRILITGTMKPELENGIPVIECDDIKLIEIPDETDKIIGKVVDTACNEDGTILNVLTADGETITYEIDDTDLCSLSADTWISLSVGDGIVYDWNYTIDEVVPQASEEFGPEIMKVTEIDFQQNLIRCKAPDEYFKDWRSAEEHVFRFKEPELVEGIEELRCYNVWYARNQMNKVFLTKIERIDCPAQFTVEFTRVPEVVMSGTGDRIKVKITNLNEFPRVYEPIFRSEEFDGYFKPERDKIEIDPGERDIFNMNFAGSYHMEGLVTFEAGAICGDVEVVKEFKILFEKPSIEIVDIPYVVKITKGGYDYFTFEVINNGNKRVKVDNYVNAPDFPGEIFPANEYYYLNPQKSREFKIKVQWDSDVELGSKHTVEYGVSLGDFIDKSAVTLQCISDIFPDIDAIYRWNDDGHLEIEGEVNWKGLEPRGLYADWDEFVEWDEERLLNVDAMYWEEIEGLPVEYDYKIQGQHFFMIKAEAMSGEVSYALGLMSFGIYPEPYLTDVIRDEKKPKVFKIEGFIDWKTFDPGTVGIFWDDSTITYGFPCTYTAKKVQSYHTGSIITKAKTGEQSYFYIWLRGFLSNTGIDYPSCFLKPINRYNIQNQDRLMRERIGRYEDIRNTHIDYLRAFDGATTKHDPSRRIGGRYFR